jgi:hypothetical protein
VSDGISLTAGGVEAMAPVDSFDLTIAPDSIQRDRVYPALSRVGAGWLFYAPHLRVDGPSIPFHLSIEVPAGWSVVGHRDEKGELVGDGYVFIGPSAYVRKGMVDVVAAPETPDWLVQMIDDTASGAVGFYERRLGAELGARPTIIVEYEPKQDGSYRGDTVPGAMVSLRFYGSSWRDPGSAGAHVVTDFLEHELFHFWNAEWAKSSEGSTRAWLHEGGANYAALLLGRERGEVTEDAFTSAINQHLERCQGDLPSLDLRSHAPKRGQGVYACGTVFQWAVDIGLRKTSNGQRDALSWWKHLLASAHTGGGSYSFDGAYALLGSDATKAADALLDPASAAGWKAFADAAHGYGVDMVLSRQPRADMVAALDHVLELSCGPERGFRTFPDHVELDAGTQCGPLSGIRDVDTVAGFSPTTQSSAMNDAVRARCAAGHAIDFGWKGKTVATAPCSKPLAAPTRGWQVRSTAQAAGGKTAH